MIKKDKGFTLIELLVVISIIAVLSSIILAALSSARSKAQDAARFEQIYQLKNTLESYYTANGTYPISQWNYDGGLFYTYNFYGASNFCGGTQSAPVGNVASGYSSVIGGGVTVPKDPTIQNPCIIYSTSKSGQSYFLIEDEVLSSNISSQNIYYAPDTVGSGHSANSLIIYSDQTAKTAAGNNY